LRKSSTPRAAMVARWTLLTSVRLLSEKMRALCDDVGSQASTLSGAERGSSRSSAGRR